MKLLLLLLLLLLCGTIVFGIGFFIGRLLQGKLKLGIVYGVGFVILLICVGITVYTDWGRQLYVGQLGCAFTSGMSCGASRK